MSIPALVFVCALGFADGESLLPLPPDPQADLHPLEQSVIDATNAERARYGLQPLTMWLPLMDSARRHTAWMTNTRTLRHTTAAVGENIAMGQRNTEEVIQSWMNSPGHRANMLNPEWTKIGVAAYRTPDGTIYWCQQFTW